MVVDWKKKKDRLTLRYIYEAAYFNVCVIVITCMITVTIEFISAEPIIVTVTYSFKVTSA